MKKFLSLVLALVMTMSLVTVSAGAKEFKDDADVTYDEAVAVISEIGVVDGDTDGNFRPTDNLSRGAAAKIICNLILGPTTAAELKADTAPYKDVPVSNTFSGYIAYCAKEGIISGYADGSFRPAGTLTGYAFMKMLLGALGYDGTYEGYTGANWSINVAKQAIGIGLNKGLTKEFNGVDFVTREEAALYAFNTLKATLVDYDQKITTNVNGVDVTITQGSAKPVTWTEGKNNDGNIKKDTFVQFAEEYFPKLVGKGSSDDFERPATQWIFDKKDIGTFVRWEKMVEKYTTGVSGKDLYDLLTGAVIDDNDVYRYVDGGLVRDFDADKVLARSNKSDLASTDNGILTEVYLDTDAKEIRIVSVNTWLAQATVDYNKSTETGTLKIFDAHKNNKTSASTETVDVEDVPAVADLTKDEYVLVNRSIKDRTKLQVVAISDVEILEDCTITGFSKGEEDQNGNVHAQARALYTSVTTGGEKYDGAAESHYDASVLNEYDAQLLKDNKYNVYLDPYGYVIGVDLFEGTKNYVFIAGYNRSENSNISIETSDAAAIFLDGTMKTIKVNVNDTNKNIDAVNNDTAYSPYFDEAKASQGHDLWVQGGEPNENKWYTYTEKDGVYTLKPVKQQSATKFDDIPGVVNGVGTIDCSKVYLKDSYGTSRPFAYGDDSSVYLVVSQGAVDTTNNKAITDVDGVYTGVQDVKIEIDKKEIKSDPVTDLNAATKTYHVDPVYTVYDGDGYVIASVVIGEAQGANKNYAYILSGAKSEGVEDGVTKWTFDAVMNGKKQTMTMLDKYGNTVNNLVPFTVQELMLDGDGNVVKVNDVDDKVTCAHKELDPNKDDVLDVTFAEGYDGRDTHNGYNYSDKGNVVAPDAAGIAYTNIVDVQSRTLTFSAMTSVADQSAHGTTGHNDRSNPVALAFAKDAPILVIQVINNEVVYQECTSVTEAVGYLNDASATTDGRQFRGRVVAMLDGGRAEWAVIINGVSSQSGSGVGPIAPGGYTPTATINGVYIDVKANTNDGNDAVVRATALQKLYDEGYSVLSVSDVGTNNNPTDYVELVASKNGQMRVFYTRLTPVSRITVDGVSGWYEEGKTIANDTAATWAVYTSAQTLPVADSTGSPAGASSNGTGNVTVAFANHNNKYLYTDLYKVTVDSTAKWYQGGMKITGLKGSVYNLTGTATDPMTVLSAGGELTVTPELGGQTVYPFWTVKAGATTKYVADGGNTTGLGLTSGEHYRTESGEFVTATGTEINGVKGDITIEDTTTTYNKVTLPINGNNGKGLGYAVTGSGKDMYLKQGETFVLEVVLNGTSTDTTAITFTAANATATNGTVQPVAGTTTGTATVSSTNTLTINPVASEAVVDLTYRVTFTVGTNDVTFS